MSARHVPDEHPASGRPSYAEHAAYHPYPGAFQLEEKDLRYPWDGDAEKAVLSCLLNDPELFSGDAMASLPSEAFHHPANRLLYTAMRMYHKQGKGPLEYITLTGFLRDMKFLEAVGGVPFLSELLHFVPTPVHYGYYKDIMLDKLTLRAFMFECMEGIEKANGYHEDVLSLTYTIGERIHELTRARQKARDGDDMKGHSVVDLMNYVSDPNDNLLGNGWLRRGGAVLFVGPSGIGKSSASMQQDIAWALGQEAFGIKAARPLRILTIQSENDGDDLHEMAEGVMEHLQLCSYEEDELYKNTRYETWTTERGNVFLAKLRQTVREFRPDLVRLDPLLAFAGCKIEDSEQMGNFLRAGLNPILQEFRCGLILAHHTPKPRLDVVQDKSARDFAYAGAGAAELTNWARAVLAIEPKGDDEFAFHAAKRGRRIGWENALGFTEYTRYFRHAKEADAMHWEEITNAEEKTRLSSPRPRKDLEAAIMSEVPLLGPIEKKVLLGLVKKKHPGIGVNALREELAMMLGGSKPKLHEWDEPREGKRPAVMVGRERGGATVGQ